MALDHDVFADRRIRPDTGADGWGLAVTFYALAFASSWAVWVAAWLVPALEDWEGLLIILGAYGPLAAALIVARRTEGARAWFRRVAGLRGRWRLALFACLLMPLVIALAHVVIFWLFVGSISLSSDPPWYWAASAAPLNVLLLFWLGSAMEEFGWQGMGVPELLNRISPLAAAGVHGVLWGVWHLPLYLLGSWSGGEQSIVALFAVTLTLSPVMIWLTGRAAGGVMPAVLFHAATNHYSALFRDPSTETALFEQPLTGSFDAIKIGIYLALAVTVIVMTRGRLAR